MDHLFIGILLGLIPAFIAKGKGRSFIGWWFYGALLFIIALPHALIMNANQTSIDKKKLSQGGKQCRYCAEIIKQEAVVCRFCSRDVGQDRRLN